MDFVMKSILELETLPGLPCGMVTARDTPIPQYDRCHIGVFGNFDDCSKGVTSESRLETLQHVVGNREKLSALRASLNCLVDFRVDVVLTNPIANSCCQ